MWISLLIFLNCVFYGWSLTFNNGGYEYIVVGISERIKEPSNCTEFFQKLEGSFRQASAKLHIGTKSRASFRKATIIIPRKWQCLSTVDSSAEANWADAKYKIMDVNQIVTIQPKLCGKPAETTMLPFKLFEAQSTSDIGNILVKEWLKLRYGIYDQHGFPNDPVYPLQENLTTDCNRESIDNKMLQCDGYSTNCSTIPLMVKTGFLPCSSNPVKPTKHSVLCGRRSVDEIVFSSNDLRNSFMTELSNLTFKYVKPALPKFILALDASAEMNQKDQWKFLRVASRRFIRQDLPNGTEIAVLTFSSTVRIITGTIVALSSEKTRDWIGAKIPEYPDKHLNKCLECVVKESIKLFEKNGGSAAGNVLLLVTSGTTSKNEINTATVLAKHKKMKILVIAYTKDFEHQEYMAKETGGLVYSVSSGNSAQLGTLVSLGDALLALMQFCLTGTPGSSHLPYLVHKAEYKDSSSEHFVNGTFFLDPSLGRNTHFALYFTSRDHPNVKNLWLTSPEGVVYEGRDEAYMSALYFSTLANIETPGLWKYAFEREPQKHQSHFVKVTSRPRLAKETVTARLLNFERKTPLNTSSEPIIFYVEVKVGDMAIRDARVAVIVNYGTDQNMEIALSDNGSGDPDITAGDGIYSRYFVPPLSGPARYSLTIVVDHNDGRAFTSRLTGQRSEIGISSCCGSQIVVPLDDREYLPAFTRIITCPSLTVIEGPPNTRDIIPPNRIADLRIFVKQEEELVTIHWTSPGDDYDHGSAAEYDLRYTSLIEEIYDPDLFDLLPVIPLPSVPKMSGTASNFSFHFNSYDTIFYFVLRAVDESDNYNEISNFVTVYIPSPSTTESSEIVTPRQIVLIPHSAQKLGYVAIAGIAAGGCVIITLMLIVACFVVVKNKKNKLNYNNNKALAEVNIYLEEGKCPNTQPEKLLVTHQKSEKPIQPTQPVHWTATHLLQEHERRNSVARTIDHFKNLEPQYGSQPTTFVHYSAPAERYDLGGGSSPNSYNSNQSDGPILPPPYEREYQGSKLPPPTFPKPALRAISYASPSLQGSFASLASDKKRRNVTQV